AGTEVNLRSRLLCQGRGFRGRLQADSEMRVFFCRIERKMLRSEKISSRLFRQSRGERRGEKGLLREIF
uniref:hypothetical protein n=1 Tax=Gemmiger formicilis TaxID=745368 RepID=UPI003FF121ED